MNDGDRAALARARSGDGDAFRTLVERHSRYLFSVAQRLTGSATDAEDVVQEAWLKAHRQLATFEERADVRTWLHRITVNCAIDLIRSRRHREDSHDPADLETGMGGDLARDPHPTPERLAEGAQIQQRVGDAMARLTGLERAAFTLRHLEGQSIEDVGVALGLKTSAAKHSIFRAVRKMRVALEPFAARKGASCS